MEVDNVYIPMVVPYPYYFVLMSLYFLGAIGNTLSIVVFSHGGFRGTPAALSHQYLCLMEIVYMIISSWAVTMSRWNIALSKMACLVFMYFISVGTLLCNWTVVIITLERLTSIILPHLVKTLWTKKRTFVLMTVMTILTIFFNCIIFVIDTELDALPMNITTIYICYPRFSDPAWDTASHWIEFMAIHAVPGGFLVVGNVLIITCLKRKSHIWGRSTSSSEMSMNRSKKSRHSNSNGLSKRVTIAPSVDWSDVMDLSIDTSDGGVYVGDSPVQNSLVNCDRVVQDKEDDKSHNTYTGDESSNTACCEKLACNTESLQDTNPSTARRNNITCSTESSQPAKSLQKEENMQSTFRKSFSSDDMLINIRDKTHRVDNWDETDPQTHGDMYKKKMRRLSMDEKHLCNAAFEPEVIHRAIKDLYYNSVCSVHFDDEDEVGSITEKNCKAGDGNDNSSLTQNEKCWKKMRRLSLDETHLCNAAFELEETYRNLKEFYYMYNDVGHPMSGTESKSQLCSNHQSPNTPAHSSNTTSDIKSEANVVSAYRDTNKDTRNIPGSSKVETAQLDGLLDTKSEYVNSFSENKGNNHDTCYNYSPTYKQTSDSNRPTTDKLNKCVSLRSDADQPKSEDKTDIFTVEDHVQKKRDKLKSKSSMISLRKSTLLRRNHSASSLTLKRQQQEKSLTITLLLISFVFLITKAPYDIHRVTLPGWPDRERLETSEDTTIKIHLAILASLFNAVSFLLYCMAGTKFREELRKTVSECWRKCRRRVL